MWEVTYTEEYENWFDTLDSQSKIVVLQKVRLLQEFGPQLSRPYADVLHGSKYSNLKELRAKTDKSVYRIAYCFDIKRRGFLLTAGDKKGKDEKLFYKKFIKEAEAIIEKYNVRS